MRAKVATLVLLALTLSGCATSAPRNIASPQQTAPPSGPPTPGSGEPICGSKPQPASTVGLHTALQLDEADEQTGGSHGSLELRNDSSSRLYVHWVGQPKAAQAFAVSDAGAIHGTGGGPGVVWFPVPLESGETKTVPASTGILPCGYKRADEQLSPGSYRFVVLIDVATSKEGEGSTTVASQPATAEVAAPSD